MKSANPAIAPATPKGPLHPYVVLLFAVLFPGSGQVLNNTPKRGLAMLFYMILLGMVTYHLTTPAQSFLGRYAGGLFIYAISLMDAYRFARYRYELFRRGGRLGTPNQS
jgi:hypothetical protein